MSVAGLTPSAKARWLSAYTRPGSPFYAARSWLHRPHPAPRGKRQRERGRDPELPPTTTPRRRVTRGKRVRICSGFYQRAEKKLGLLSPVHDTLERQPPLPPLLPTPFCVSQHPHHQTSHRRGWGSRRPDKTQLQLRGADSGGRLRRGTGGATRKASGVPSPAGLPRVALSRAGRALRGRVRPLPWGICWEARGGERGPEPRSRQRRAGGAGAPLGARPTTSE